MEGYRDRRSEQRLRYYWPIWFSENSCVGLTQGQMIDVSSRGASFTCRADDTCPYNGQHITANFSVPRFGQEKSFDMTNFTRSAHVCRVDEVNGFLRRVALQFAEPLPFRPGEQDSETKDELLAEQNL